MAATKTNVLTMLHENLLRAMVDHTATASRFAVFAFHLTDDPDDVEPLKLHFKMHDWPTADFPSIIRMLRKEFEKEMKRLVQANGAADKPDESA